MSAALRQRASQQPGLKRKAAAADGGGGSAAMPPLPTLGGGGNKRAKGGGPAAAASDGGAGLLAAGLGGLNCFECSAARTVLLWEKVPDSCSPYGESLLQL